MYFSILIGFVGGGFIGTLLTLSYGEKSLVTTSVRNQFEVDAVYNTAGRVPMVESLNLEQAQVTDSTHGIKVDKYLTTNQPTIFALGDCCCALVLKLAKYTVYQGEYLIDYPIGAMSTFSKPRLAQKCVTIAEAKLAPERFELTLADMSKWIDGKRNAEKIALLKTVIKKSDDRIVGATVISQDGNTLVNYITMESWN